MRPPEKRKTGPETVQDPERKGKGLGGGLFGGRLGHFRQTAEQGSAVARGGYLRGFPSSVRRLHELTSRKRA